MSLISLVLIAMAQDNVRKRHLVVDTRDLPLMVMVTPADLHDSAAAKKVLFRLMHPEITRLEHCSIPVDRFREGGEGRTFPNDPLMVTE